VKDFFILEKKIGTLCTQDSKIMGMAEVENVGKGSHRRAQARQVPYGTSREWAGEERRFGIKTSSIDARPRPARRNDARWRLSEKMLMLPAVVVLGEQRECECVSAYYAGVPACAACECR